MVKNLVFSDGQQRTHAELVNSLEKVVDQARPLAEKYEGFNEYVVDPEGNPDFLNKLTKGLDSSPAKWAASIVVLGSGLFEDANLDDKLRQVLIWQIAKFRSMLVFTEHIEDLAWRGYFNYGVDVIDKALTAWDTSEKKEPERYWQRFLKEQPYLINLIFPGPVAIRKGEAYLGGKKIDNTGGRLVDFLVEHSIGGNAALLELKRPVTPLVTKRPYRGSDIYAASSDLAGAVSQILHYRDSIMSGNKNMVDTGEGGSLHVFVPTCVVLIGNYASELDSEDRRRSFELYRASLNGVSIVTYDELFERLRKILDVLRGN
ncbi:Uncharacterised protein [Mycobacteroides abscessus subsp. abscessus]|uniref:Shedu immune nuclease family protein n=1 Tax=Mycobacteroides abscessus TaxID=36809 RepID=UPI00092AE338|nr:Shedu immune nuclease family protein [Mycobacteroides abscessus]SIC78137.1 Uncharacterised protein [Mycobacteroides abscessus subsp. abscessus]